MKVSRNEPCSCGSGKKYKKCCMAKEIIDASSSKSVQEDMAIAMACHQKGDIGQAALLYADVLERDPQNAMALNYFGSACCQAGRFDVGLDMIEKSIALKPASFEAYNNLILLLRQTDDRLRQYEWMRKGLRSKFEDDLPRLKIEETRLAWLYWLVNSEFSTNETILEDCLAWRSHSLLTSTHAQLNAMVLEPDRPLKIGYLMSFLNFSNYVPVVHSIFANLDQVKFKLYVYNFGEPATEFAGYEHVVFRDMRQLDVSAAIRQIQLDGIDLLVDFNGFADIRTIDLLFNRVAPVQAIYGNIYSTTAIPHVDYIYTLEGWVPEDEDKYYVEDLYRLPDSCFWVWVPKDAPPVDPPPSLTNDYFTFGCFSSNYKVNMPVMRLWVQVLKACPNSRFMLKGSDAATQERFISLLKAEGLPPDRLIVEAASGYHEYLQSYGKVDVVLDTFPYNGVTTTNEALAQGVPVVAIRGERWVGRFAALLLKQLGLTDLVAESPEQYVEIACRLYQCPERGQELRSVLRNKMRSLATADSVAYVRELEKSYRWMWRRWLDRPSS